MHIPKAMIDDGVALLNQDEDEILIRLGAELYSLERQQPSQSLAGAIPIHDLKQKAVKYLESKREALRQTICPEWKKQKRGDFLDTMALLTFVTELVTRALGIMEPYLKIAVGVSAFIVKRGIDGFCKE